MRPEFTKIFYQFLDREISIEEFFDFVYDNPELQKDISDEKYYNLIGFDWSRKNSDFMLEYFLFDSCIDRGKYWTHRLIGLLNRFEKEEENFESNMESLYDFYEESNPEGNDFDDYYYHHEGCTFLEYIGGAYFSYRQEYSHSDWKIQDSEEELLEELATKYGHKRLAKVSEKIRRGLEENRIQIDPDGRFSMDLELSEELRKSDLFH